jgi:transposase-like protein
MAKPKYSGTKVISDWKTGQYSIRKLALKHGISPTKAHDIVKGINRENEQLIERSVELEQELMLLPEQERASVRNEVDIRLKHLAFIDNATAINISRMLKKYDKKSPEYQAEMSMMDHKLAQSTIKDGRESLLGKEASSQTNIQMNSTTNEALQRIEIIAVSPNDSSS